jgi:hypothetical protein
LSVGTIVGFLLARNGKEGQEGTKERDENVAKESMAWMDEG